MADVQQQLKGSVPPGIKTLNPSACKQASLDEAKSFAACDIRQLKPPIKGENLLCVLLMSSLTAMAEEATLSGFSEREAIREQIKKDTALLKTDREQLRERRNKSART